METSDEIVKDDVKQEIEEIPEGYQRCHSCGKILPLSEFYKHSRNKSGYSYQCKECKKYNILKARCNNNINEKLKDITSRELITELRNRGYRGKLTFTTVKEVVI